MPRAAAISRARTGAPVERLNGVARQRAEAHRRDVDDGGGPERPGTVACGAVPAERAVLDHRIAARVLDVVIGAEAEVVVLLLRRRVHPTTLVAGERAFLVVCRDDVLAQLRTDGLEQVPRVPDDREVAAEVGVFALEEVPRVASGRADAARQPPDRPDFAVPIGLSVGTQNVMEPDVRW